MRLLLITNVFPNRLEPTKGTFNFEMARTAQRLGHEIEVVAPISWTDEWTLRRRGGAHGFLRDRHDVLDGIPVHYPRYWHTPGVLRTCYGWFLWRSVRRTLLPVLHADPPDAILAYWAHPDGAVAVRAARIAGRPCIVMVGGSDVLVLTKRAARRRCILRVLRSADAVVAVSQDIRAKLCEFALHPAKIHVVYRGVDTEQFSPGERREARRRLGLSLDRPLLLWVGRMALVKGLNVLVDACSILKAHKIDFHVALVGSGPLEERLKAACLERGLGEHVRFARTALHHDLPDWYRAADMTVLPSLSEGVPNVLLESIACGTPFVASRVGGVPEIATEGIDRLVPPNDPVALAEAVEQQLAPHGPLPARDFLPAGLPAAARRLLEVIEGAVRDGQCRAAPSADDSHARLSTTSSRWSWRQVARQVMSATMPRRMVATHGPSKRPLVWLTFDDGPHPDFTPLVLDALLAQGVRATFFVVGQQAEQHPELVRRIVREGHALGHHTYFHRGFDQTTNRQLLEGVRRTSDLLFDLVGKRPTFFRPPHGHMRVSAMCRLWAAGQVIVLWNSDPKDYSLASPEELVRWFRQHPLQGGDIALLHDNRPYAAAALRDIIEGTRQRRLEFATIDDPALFG